MHAVMFTTQTAAQLFTETLNAVQHFPQEDIRAQFKSLTSWIGERKEFKDLVHGLGSLSRYRPEEGESDHWGLFRMSRAALELQAFLRRTGCITQILKGEQPDANAFINEFVRESERKTYWKHFLVLIGGLDIQFDFASLPDGSNLKSFQEVELRMWCESEISQFQDEPIIDFRRFSELSFLQKSIEIPVGAADATNFDFRSTEAALSEIVEPWQYLINLIDDRNIRAIQLIEKTDLRTNWPFLSMRSVAEPPFQMNIDPDGEEYETPYAPRMLTEQEVQELVSLYNVWLASVSANHRAKTAARFFERACKELWAADTYMLEPNILEDIIVNGVTALEALLLEPRQLQKTKHLSCRGAALLSKTDNEIADIYKLLENLYDVRGQIVHGADQKPKTELEAAARSVLQNLRLALRAFVRMRGDFQRIIDGVSNEKVRAENRHLVYYDL